MHPTIVEMFINTRRDDLERSMRDARRGRTGARRHLLRRAPAADRRAEH